MGAVITGGGGDVNADGANGSDANPAHKANISDPSAIKAVLDLSTIQVMRKKYEEDHLHSNVKLGLGFMACLVGVSAYLYPIPFPKNKWFLKWCVILYFVFSSVMQAISTVFFRDLVFMTKTQKVRNFDDDDSIVNHFHQYPTKKDNFYIRVVSKLPRYHTIYNLRMTAILNDNPSRVEKEIDIQDYFDVEGYFDQNKYRKVVEDTLAKALKLSGKKDQ